MTYPLHQTIFVGNRSYPPQLRGTLRVHEERWPPASYAWCCPVCGEIWARAVVRGRDFQFLTHVCEAHEDPQMPSLLVPGSLLMPWDENFNAALGSDLWLREFTLHFNHAQRYKETAE